jgi:hypothetical protein
MCERDRCAPLLGATGCAIHCQALLHYRRVASLIIGAWIAGSVLIGLAARQFRDVEHVFHAPAPEHHEVIASLQQEPLRQVLLYHVWEKSRTIMYWWGGVQFLIGPLLIWTLLLSMRVNRLIIGAVAAMLIIAGFNQFIIGPEMTYAGRALAFGDGGRGRYLILNSLLIGFEILKILMGLMVAWYLFTYRSRRDTVTPALKEQSSRRGRSRREADAH